MLIYDTKPVAGRLCVPSSEYLYRKVSPALFEDLGQHHVMDIKRAWPVVLGSLGVAILIGLAFTVLMRLCETFVVWVLLLASTSSLIILGIFLMTPRDNNNKTEYK